MFTAFKDDLHANACRCLLYASQKQNGIKNLRCFIIIPQREIWPPCNQFESLLPPTQVLFNASQSSILIDGWPKFKRFTPAVLKREINCPFCKSPKNQVSGENDASIFLNHAFAMTLFFHEPCMCIKRIVRMLSCFILICSFTCPFRIHGFGVGFCFRLCPFVWSPEHARKARAICLNNRGAKL